MAEKPNHLSALFSPPVWAWLEESFPQPTPPQIQGWPAIERGEHTLILAPTGSGKTLAAFLWGIDRLYRDLTADTPLEPGVRILYISPLKALNNDVYRNLRLPLRGIRRTAQSMDLPFPDIRVATRSGDTPTRERQAMLRKPPHILITTPESLYLMLTSPRAREIFRSVQTVIVDEIHTLAGNKRGVHLSLSLERLTHHAETPPQRIGLSATIRPLAEVARFLGGNEGDQPRPVTLIDAATPKAMDLRVVSLVEDFSALDGDSIWPILIPRLITLIEQHRTTLIFCKSRRQAERVANRLNEQLAAGEPEAENVMLADGVVSGIGLMGTGTGSQPAAIRAHHGSMSREARLEMERDLKKGRLKALVATSSLELGIDIGSIDLVVQLHAPKSVAQGLQRVGRSGHLVGQTSYGRLFPLHREDVMEAAAVAGGMLHGTVEPTITPRNPLDVLAQQIVAMVSVIAWGEDDLYRLVRGAYAYGDLTPSAFRAVLEMLSGRYPSEVHQQLRARLDWDRVNQRLNPLPGARTLALTNGGTITDRGMFAAYRAESRTKLGDLDEEFVYESRTGDTFMLGSQVWRVVEITNDRVLVREAPGAVPRMPFWRGEFAWRAFDLGRRIGRFRRHVAARIQAIGAAWDSYHEITQHRESQPVRKLITWLGDDFALNAHAAWQVIDYVVSQLDSSGAISSDRTIIVEIFPDDMGLPQLVVHSPFGGRVNGPWSLALAGAIREQTGINVEAQSNDDGILLRLPDATATFPDNLVASLGPGAAREYLMRELPDSAIFGAQFRQNAARALLLPGGGPGKRTPFWLQRLKAKDLMQVVRQFDDFPIIIETYRDCLEDVMDLPHLEHLLGEIERGEVAVIVNEPALPSPLAIGLMRQFIDIYLYEWDAPRAERQLQQLTVNRDLLQDVLKDVDLGELLNPAALGSMAGQLQHTAETARARSPEELALILAQMGDLTTAEIAERTVIEPATWLQTLANQDRLGQLPLPTAAGPETRWVSADLHFEYTAAFGLKLEAGTADTPAIDPEMARQTILTRFLSYSGPLTMAEIRARYDFPVDWLAEALAEQVTAGNLAQGRFSDSAQDEPQFLTRRNLEQAHRRSISLLRREVQPVPFTLYADFLATWQGIGGQDQDLPAVLAQLRALPVPALVWERDLLPARLPTFQPATLEALCRQGEVVWVAGGGATLKQSRLRFLFRGDGNTFLTPPPDDLTVLDDDARQVYALLKSEGALFLSDMQSVLRWPEARLQTALATLAGQSLVTNDSLATLRRLMKIPAPKPTPDRHQSSLAAELAARRQGQSSGRGRSRRPSRATYQAAKRRVQDRLAQQVSVVLPEPSAGQGRWSLVHRLGVLGGALSLEEQVARQARQLLQRWGVVTRETLAAEEGAWDWGLLYAHLSLLEMRGEVRRGVFVSGLPGLQFALPEVVEALRTRRDEPLPEPEPAALMVLNACDPANLYGPSAVQGPLTAAGEPLTFTRRPSTWLVQQHGSPILLIEGGGATLTSMQGVSLETIRRALDQWLDGVARHTRRLTVKSWNGQPILESEGQAILAALNFRRDYPGMIWDGRV